MVVASIRETHSKWRRTRNGCVATRGTQKTSPFGIAPIRNGLQFRQALWVGQPWGER